MKQVILFLYFILCTYLLQAQSYVFFLHNAFLEQNSIDASHPQYGKYEYKEIINAFKKEGLIVISEKREGNTDVTEYSRKMVKQIDSLHKIGIPSSHITVIGTSKGGYIAMHISKLLNDKNVNFVFIACCDQGGNSEINFCGNILSIYEKSDAMGSCAGIKKKSPGTILRFKEIELNTGLKHGFQFKALDAWIQPASQWAKGNYH